jgi:ribosomal-protein-alanine N-acetyltransferase
MIEPCRKARTEPGLQACIFFYFSLNLHLKGGANISKLVYFGIDKQMVITSDRLVLREFTVEDAGGIFALNSNPDVMQHTGVSLMQSVDEALDFINGYTEYADYGYGSWACLLKDSGEFIGAFGLRYRPQQNIVTIGGLFLPAYWGMGYATEATVACLDYAFKQLDIATVSAYCTANNLASVAILEKLGFKKTGAFEDSGNMVFIYQIEKGKWRMR